MQRNQYNYVDFISLATAIRDNCSNLSASWGLSLLRWTQCHCWGKAKTDNCHSVYCKGQGKAAIRTQMPWAASPANSSSSSLYSRIFLTKSYASSYIGHKTPFPRVALKRGSVLSLKAAVAFYFRLPHVSKAACCHFFFVILIWKKYWQQICVFPATCYLDNFLN